MGQFMDTYNKLIAGGKIDQARMLANQTIGSAGYTEIKEHEGMKPKVGLKQLKQQYDEYAKADIEATRDLWEATTAKYVEERQKPDNVKRFELLGAEKALLYARKNADYGDSFNKSLDEDGLLVAKIRLGDKFSRFCQLLKNPAQVTEEKLRETLIDLSNYTDMTILWMDDKEEQAKYDDAMDALAQAVVASGADWDGDFVNGTYVNLKDGVITNKIVNDKHMINELIGPQQDMFTTPEARVDTMTGADYDGDICNTPMSYKQVTMNSSVNDDGPAKSYKGDY
jgi:hypothetical protein